MSGQDRNALQELRNDLLIASAFTAHGLDEDAQAGLEETLSPAAHLVKLAERSLHALVSQARSRGATWTEIGKQLGMSRQAAQKRFQGKVPEKVVGPRAKAPQERVDQALSLLEAAADGRLYELEAVASPTMRAKLGEPGLAPQFQTINEIFGSFVRGDLPEVTRLGTVILVTRREERSERDAIAEISLSISGVLLGIFYRITEGATATGTSNS